MQMFIHVPRERRARRESQDDERLQRTFRRNFIIMFLSLALAATAILSARLCGPQYPPEKRSPEIVSLENQLRTLFPERKVSVTEIIGSEGERTIEIEITAFEKVDNPAPIIARAESVVYDESLPGETRVVIKILEEENGKTIVTALHSTTMRKIGEKLKIGGSDEPQN